MVIRKLIIRCPKYGVSIVLGGNILIVGHATTLDTCTRHIVGEKLRSTNDMSRIMQKVPYCSMAVIESEDGIGDWKLVEPPCDPITHTNNNRFDWKILT